MSSFENTVDRIYQAAVEPDHWPSVLHDIGCGISTPMVMLLTLRSDKWIGWRGSFNTPATVNDYLLSDASSRSEATPRLMRANAPGFISARDLFTDEEFLADPLMSEWGTRSGMHHGAATAINLPTGDSVIVHLQRRSGMAPFSAADIAYLDAFRPHLARAGMLVVRWKMERMRAAAEALALIGLPAAVLDRSGKVLLVNRLIDDMSSWIAWLPGDRLALIDAAANELLRQALKEIANPVSLAVRSFALKPKQNTQAAVAHVVPTTGLARELFGGAYGILVVTRVSTSSAPTTAILSALFDLTPSEARVASGIAEGLSLEKIASRHAVRVQTVRVQIKAVFAKTGTNRQAQLAALLAAQPKIPIDRE